MKRIVFAVAAMAAIAFGGSEKALAVNPSGYPFYPFGFYQPYGAQYGNSLATPPYFALNPPVYYGARHSRPYGMSPFASPPVVRPADNYRGRLRTDFYLPASETQPTELVPTEAMPIGAPPAVCNPCVNNGAAPVSVKVGLVRSNPFVTKSQLATK